MIHLMVSESLDIPSVLVDFADDAALRILVSVHAAGPCFLALVWKAVHLIFARVLMSGDRLLAKSLFHVWLQGELRICWHMSSLLNLINLTSHNSVNVLISSSWELVSCLSSELGSDFRILDFLPSYLRLDSLGKWLWGGVSLTIFSLVHDHFFICQSCLVLHWISCRL